MNPEEYKRVVFAIRTLAQTAKRQGWQVDSADVKAIIANPQLSAYILKFLQDFENQKQGTE